MYQNPHQGHNNLLSSRTTFPPERNLFLQRGSSTGDQGLVLSTEAKPRLKWTPELHARFLEAVNQLGGADKATPKAIMRLMAIPELTLYHLKSHLQKYRLGKNLQAQINTGITKNDIGCALAAERTPEDNGSSAKIAAPANKNIQINETLKMQMDVQRQLHQQLEVQRHLQLKIEAQGKYLQSLLEKAQETIGKENLGSAGKRMRLPEMVPKVSIECFSNSFPDLEKNPGLHVPQLNPGKPADCSAISCFTSFDGPQKVQDAPDASMGIRAHHEDFSPCRKQFGEHSSLEQAQPPWRGDLNGQKTFTSSILWDSENTIQMSVKPQRANGDSRAVPEVRRKETDDEDKFPEHTSNKRPAAKQESGKQSNGSGLPFLTTELELRIHEDNGGAASCCKQLDLNGFSWN